jgi:enoyl-[acyl-carrier protein] reductase I
MSASAPMPRTWSPNCPGAQLFQCDVSFDADVDRVFAELKERYGKLHVLVHSIGFAPPDALQNPFTETTRESFRIAHDVSVYSLIALARGAAPLMTDGGSIITSPTTARKRSSRATT